MTLKTIRDTILAIVGSDTELQVADLNTFINEGKSMIESKILDEKKDFFPDNESISVSASDIDITPTKTWIAITLVQIDFGEGGGYQTLTKASMEQVLGVNSTDTRGELVYHLWGDVIYVPNFAKAFTMRIYGYVVPDDLSADGDTPVFSKLLHPLLVTWGVSRAIESNTSNENYLDGERKRREFWAELDEILPTVITKDSTNIRSLI